MLDPVELFPEVPNLYEFTSVHADMVFDDRRVTAYKRAIDSVVKPGNVVVDLGAGTGLLSFLSLQAGAKRVHAIERSSVIELAKRISDRNGFTDRIIFHHDDGRNVDIGEKADVIVSELIGHMAFEEGMAESIIDAKNRFLTPKGISIPDRVTLSAALVSEKNIYDTYIEGWKEISEIDYSVMKEQALKSVYITEISERDLLSNQRVIKTVNFSDNDLDEYSDAVVFNINRPGIVNGVALWFDALLTAGVRLSSGPWAKTHWNQCFVPFKTPVNVMIDEDVSVKFNIKLRNHSEDDFKFSAIIQR